MSPEKLKNEKSQPSRRRIIENGIKWAARAAAALVAGKTLLNIKDRQGSESPEDKESPKFFKEYSSLQIPNSPNTTLKFIGVEHYPPQASHSFEEISNSIKNSDIVLIEYFSNENSSDLDPEYLKLFSLKLPQGKKEIMTWLAKQGPHDAREYFNCLKLLAFLHNKKVICSDPDNFSMGKKGNRYWDERFATLFETTSAISSATAIPVTISAVTAETIRAMGGDKAVDTAVEVDTFTALSSTISLLMLLPRDNLEGRLRYADIVPEKLQQTTFGKTLVELSFANFREFIVARNLLLEIRKNPDKFKDRKVLSFYGAVHFPLMQILNLPLEIIEYKLKYYFEKIPELKELEYPILTYTPEKSTSTVSKPKFSEIK